MGFNRPAIIAPLIQQLTANNLITRIELENTHFSSSRRAIIETTKIIFFGILYRRFRPSLKAVLLDSSIVQSLRSRGVLPGSERSIHFAPSAVAKFTTENAGKIQAMKESLLLRPFQALDNKKDMEEARKTRWKEMARQFLDSVDNDTWFLFNYVNRSPDRNTILHSMEKTLIQFMGKTGIADAIAFMLVELLQNAETEHFKYLAMKDHMARVKGDGIFEMLRDKTFRNNIMLKARKTNALMHVVYHFDNLQYTNNSKKTRLRVSVTNNGRMDVKNLGDKKNHTPDRTEISLIDHLLSDPESLGAPMGMVYYKLLEDACREQQVKLQASFSTDKNRNQTTALMTVII